MLKLQEDLAKDPNAWMVTGVEKGSAQVVHDEHMSEFAAKFKVGQRVIVLTSADTSSGEEPAQTPAAGAAAGAGGEDGKEAREDAAQGSSGGGGGRARDQGADKTSAPAAAGGGGAAAPIGHASGRRAEVMFIGKIPEMPAGYWIGVEYDEPVGKNDGSVKGRRCFECNLDYGGFVRPDKIQPDPDPPATRHTRSAASAAAALDAGAGGGEL